MRNLTSLLVTPTTSISDTISAIDRGAAQIALVTDGNRRLAGTVTDGDVRRAILKGVNLESAVGEIMSQSFRWLPETASDAEALSLMRAKALHQVPALDKDGRVVRLFLLEELLQQRRLINPVLLMAGGTGQRLRPLTDDTPKPMLLVGGKPILERILEQCVEAGFRNFWISVRYLKDQIKDYFANGSRWDVSIRYLEEAEPMGTAGALGMLPECPLAPIMVMNGDVLTRVNFRSLIRFHEEHRSTATVCVRQHIVQIPYGVVQTSNARVLSIEEKPLIRHSVNAGLYLLNPEILSLVPGGCESYDMPTLFKQAIQAGLSVNAFPIHEYWLDVGRPETLQQANGDWS